MNVDLGKSFSDALGVSVGDLVGIAGAGGKTSLMYTLGREIAGRPCRVLLTTTTKIIYPQGGEVAKILLGPETEETLTDVKAGLESGGPLLVGRERQHSKIIGYSGWFVDALHSQAAPATVISECDGAMGKSLKIPRGWEPILPSETNVYVVVIGADCIGKPLGPDTVFQAEAFGALAGVKPGTDVDVRLVARMMLAPDSYLDRKPAGASCCVFINKWDAVQTGSGGRASIDQDPAMALALDLVRATGVDRVVVGSLKLGSGNPIMVVS